MHFFNKRVMQFNMTKCTTIPTVKEKKVSKITLHTNYMHSPMTAIHQLSLILFFFITEIPTRKLTIKKEKWCLLFEIKKKMDEEENSHARSTLNFALPNSQKSRIIIQFSIFILTITRKLCSMYSNKSIKIAQ